MRVARAPPRRGRRDTSVRSGDRGTDVVYEKDTKNHQHRTVTLSEFALDWLLDHQDRHAKACALCGAELSEDAYVLAPEPGGLTPWQCRTPPGRSAGCATGWSSRRGCTSTALRHLQVAPLLDAGIPLRSVSGRIGHLNMTTTGNIYAHWIQESDTRSASVVDERIWGHERRNGQAVSPDLCNRDH